MLTVYVSLLWLFVLLGTLQYENAIPLPKDDESAAHILVLSFMILFGMCVLCGISLWAGKGLLLKLLHVPELIEFLWLIPFSLFGVGTYNILNRWNMRKKTFDRIAKTKVTQSIGMVGTMITAGFLKQGLLGLLLGDVIGRMGGSGRLTYLLLKEDWQLIRKVSGVGIRQAAVRFKRFPLISVGSALLKELSEQMPNILLAIAFGPQVVGLYMLVQRILGLPLSLIGYSVGSVFMEEATSLMQKNKAEQIGTLYWRTLKHMFFISVPLIAALALFAPWAFPVIFGPVWSEAGVYLRILSPMYLLQFLSSPLSTVLFVLERQDLQLCRELIRFGLLLVSMLMVVTANLPPLAAVSLLALSGSAAFLRCALMSWLAIKNNCKRKK